MTESERMTTETLPPQQAKTPYQVQTEVFEGPLDLLLSLIEKRKLLINEISLAKVADDFIAYVKRHPEFPLGEAAHFVLIASTLVLIKSKSLLPQLSLAPEEEENIEDLQARLKAYQRVRDAAQRLRTRFGSRILFSRNHVPAPDVVFMPDERTSVSDLRLAIGSVLENLPKQEEQLPKATVKQVVSLEEMIERLTQRVQGAIATSFKEFSGMGKEERVTVAVSFLAMLELVKQGLLRVEQSSRFSDIVMESDSVETPHYG